MHYLCHFTVADKQAVLAAVVVCVIQGFHASRKVLDFFLENSRTWKVLEKYP